MMYGDDDPEDAWSASDPVVAQLLNLMQRVRWIRARIADAVVQAHAERLEDDLEFLRLRVMTRDLD